MPNLQEVLDTQKQLEVTLGSRMAHFEKMLQPSSGSLSEPNFEFITREFYEFKMFALDVFRLLRSQIETLSSQVDEIDTHNRRNALLLHGLPEKENENCTAVVINIIHSTMSLKSVLASNIYLCHRLGSRTDKRARPILVRFTDINVRNLVWREKKLLKSSPAVLCEFLTRTRHNLFFTARKHFGVTSCWTSNGVVYVKTLDNVRNRITSAQELDKIIARFPMVSSDAASGSRVADVVACPKASPKQAGLNIAPPAAFVPPHTRSRNVLASKSKENLDK